MSGVATSGDALDLATVVAVAMAGDDDERPVVVVRGGGIRVIGGEMSLDGGSGDRTRTVTGDSGSGKTPAGRRGDGARWMPVGEMSRLRAHRAAARPDYDTIAQ